MIGIEREVRAVVTNRDGVAFFDCTSDDVAAESRFDGVCNQAAKRTGTELRVKAFVGQGVKGFVCASKMNLDLFFQTFVKAVEQDFGNVFDLIFLESLEDDDVIDTVEEFRTEVLLEQFMDFLASFVKVFGFQDFMRPKVTGHDDDGVLEVDDPAFPVGQAAIIKDL